jgi:4-amino-4-deoxy-L-arabinose transferase-like glycosyltransferase
VPRIRVGAVAWPLILILGMQTAVSVVTLHNTAFQDEALYLYAGRQIFHHLMGGPAPFDHYAFYFSGYPYVYPLIGGVLDTIGGLALARSFSLACMLGVTTTVYFVTIRLFGLRVAVLSTAVYASMGVVLFVGRLATFDALCLFLVALATALALRTATGGRPRLALAVGPALVLAILAKYAGLLFVLPVFGLMVVLGLECLGWRATLLRLAMALATFSLSIGVAYEVIDNAALHAIAGSTTNRATGLKAPRLALFLHVLEMGGVVYLFALAGLVLLLLHRGRFRIPAMLLFASSLLVPAYHIYKQEPISLDKHIAYALFFAVPLAGYAIAWLSGLLPRGTSEFHRGHWLAGLAVAAAVFTLGLRQSHMLYSNWANTTDLSYALHTQLRNGTGRIFAEDIEVARYAARDVSQEWQWNSFYYPYYVDKHHHRLFGNQALTQAIRDRYYSSVELSFNYFPAQAYFLAQQMADTRNYDLIAAMPLVNSYGRGHYFLWRSALIAGQGNFTSVAQVTTKKWYKCQLPICQP